MRFAFRWTLVGVASCAAAMLVLTVSLRAAEVEPIKGYEVGPTMDRIAPGEFIVDPPTLQNLGFRWYVQGDSNRNASVAVSYRRKGEADWRQVLPMLRVHHEVANQDYGPFRCGNLFAGSVMFLEAETEYEVRFEMQDPDGGAAPVKVVTAKTRGEPRLAQAGREVHVYPKTAEGKPPAEGVQGLRAACDRAEPGDLFLLHAGVYDEGSIELARSGLPGRPIVFRGAGDGEAVLQGPDHKGHLLRVTKAAHVWFEDLTFRRANIALYAGAGNAGCKGLVVRRCRFEDLILGIHSISHESEDWYIADNVLTGLNPTWYPRPKKYMEPSHTGINVYGQGIVVCHNRISRFSDALAIANYGVPSMDPKKQCVAVDFYNNDLSFAQDDTIETDYGCHNIRVYRNRCYNAHTALSVQPSYGGPIYLIRNEAFSITALPLKLHNYCTGLEIYHNTLLTAGQGFKSYHKWQNAILRNNLLLGATRYAVETGSPTPWTTLDYNGYRKTDDPERFIKWHNGKDWLQCADLQAFFKATGYEEHGRMVDYDVFVKAAKPEPGQTREPADLDLRLRPGCPPVDAGCRLPNVNDDFTGAAPDLGCHETGKPTPQYGPRAR